jgi:predicted transcriptional regulator
MTKLSPEEKEVMGALVKFRGFQFNSKEHYEHGLDIATKAIHKIYSDKISNLERAIADTYQIRFDILQDTHKKEISKLEQKVNHYKKNMQIEHNLANKWKKEVDNIKKQLEKLRDTGAERISNGRKN